jgi:dolichol-phosphate mannosyltransferase
MKASAGLPIFNKLFKTLTQAINAMNMLRYSVIVPLKNEEGNLEKLIQEIDQAMTAQGHPWELLCIDDGSTDKSVEILKQMQVHCLELKVFQLQSNVGQSSALQCGFDHALAPWIITLDADLQNDPADIKELCAFEDQYDLICGRRQKRQDSLQKRMISRIANRIRSFFCQDGIDDTGCSLKLIRTSALRKIFWFRGAHRFIPALFLLSGFTVYQTTVRHRNRYTGKSHYHLLNRGIGPIIDLLAMVWLKRRFSSYTLKSKLEAEK